MANLKAHKSRPFLSFLDMTGVTAREIGEQYPAFQPQLMKMKMPTQEHPEIDAIKFYLQNHAMAEICRLYDPLEPLGEAEEIVHDYVNTSQMIGLRLFYYLFFICARESRHMHSGHGKSALLKKYPTIMGSWHSGVGDSNAIAGHMKLIPKEVTLGEYADWSVDAFKMAQYGGGYGGQKWADVALPFREFVHGTITAEMLLDTGYTLCHNGGPIFNKGMLYTHYDAGALRTILDVQRSGQIPALVDEGHPQIEQFRTKEVVDMFKKIKKVLPDFGGYVDWYAVEALGSVGKYSSEKAQQVAKHGKSTKIEEYEKKAAEKKAAEKAKLEKKVAEAKAAVKAKMEKEYEIMPGLWVSKVKMMRKT